MKYLFFILLPFLFIGCSVKTGAKFSQFDKPQNSKDSLIYIYRPSAFAGSAVDYDVFIENKNLGLKRIGTLGNGTYLKTLAPANQYEIWAKTEAKVELLLDVKDRQIYCLKGGVGFGFFIGRPTFEWVGSEQCKKEIAETKISLE